MKAYLKKRVKDLLNAMPGDRELDDLLMAVHLIKDSLNNGGKLLACGNGGSAADAQHIVAEFVVKYKNPRQPFAAIALSTDTSILTACSNDFGFEYVFERQIEAIGKKDDVLLAISTSGNSDNVNRAVRKAKAQGMKIIYMTGKHAPHVMDSCDVVLYVNSIATPIIQEVHRIYGHLLVELFELMEGVQ